MPSVYNSSIPSNAKQRITQRYPSGKKRRAEFWLARKLVGARCYFESGEPELEYGLKDGKKHGVEYDWIDPGKLTSAEPFSNGLAHGVAKQWDCDGRLLGSYTMRHGTGIDLWRQRREDGSICLSEVMYCKDGTFHGWQWWLDESQKSVFIERHWQNGKLHGVEREWNEKERLCRGYPKYFVAGVRVIKRQYLKACSADPTLPPFNLKENNPARRFPAEIAKHMRG